MNANATQLNKGDKLRITTTTAGPETLELVGACRCGGTQYVYLANARASAAIKLGDITPDFGVLTGLYRVRKLETQYVYRLMAKGLAVKV
jgi:hypothetical protein